MVLVVVGAVQATRVATRGRLNRVAIQRIRSSFTYRCDAWRRSSTFNSSNRSLSSKMILKVREVAVTDLPMPTPLSDNDKKNDNDDQKHKTLDDRLGILYTYNYESYCKSWTKAQSHDDNKDNDDTSTGATVSDHGKILLQQKSKQVASLLLPAQYPKSVAPGYLGFAGFCFTASIAGSAAMVLSTQTLLLAVGVVGQNVQQASIMAGAFNWVMKDFVGQLGGVLFASQMGKTRAFDSDPKRWRMVAAMALDGATWMEIVAPLFHSSLVLPVASVANIGKNIGFLTASASRAALHNAMAVTGNLGDVTAKSGSQSIMASLLGTSFGIGLSSWLQHDTYNFALGFLGLTIIHQGCNYLSLQYVPLAYFNRQRLLLVLEQYLEGDHEQNGGGTVPNPTQIARLERFFPLTAPLDAAEDWLRIGRPLLEMCPDPAELESLMLMAPKEAYLIRIDSDGSKPIVNLVYLTHATGDDVIKGMLHAFLLQKAMADGKTKRKGATKEGLQTHQQVVKCFPALLLQLQEQGWKTDSTVIHVESSSACRLKTD